MAKLRCPHCKQAYADAIEGVEVGGVYDGVLFWHCLTCDKAWPRRFRDHKLALASISHVEDWNCGR